MANRLIVCLILAYCSLSMSETASCATEMAL